MCVYFELNKMHSLLQESKWRPFMLKPMPSPLMKPVLVFVNPKSGGNQVSLCTNLKGLIVHVADQAFAKVINVNVVMIYKYLTVKCYCWFLESSVCLVSVCLSGDEVVADVHVDSEPSAGVWSVSGWTERSVSFHFTSRSLTRGSSWSLCCYLSFFSIPEAESVS